MIPTFILGLIGRGVPTWLKGPWRYVADFAIVAALAVGAYLLIFHVGEQRGAAKVERKVEKAHTAAVAEARHDERAMQAVADDVGRAATVTNDKHAALAAVKTKEVHDAIDRTPPAVPGASAPAVDVDSVSDALDDLVADANRAAGPAGAAGGAQPH